MNPSDDERYSTATPAEDDRLPRSTAQPGLPSDVDAAPALVPDQLEPGLAPGARGPGAERRKLDQERGRIELSVAAERVLLVGIRTGQQAQYEADESLRELSALVATAGGVPIDEGFRQRVVSPAAGRYLGSGKVEEIKERLAQGGIDAVAVDVQLTPRQARNLENDWNCKVLDRSEIILDIFADHAQTHQARVQVELAQLRYTRGRLRRMWTHLDREGSAGIGSRGPGEKQLEVDRRLIRKRIGDLQRELEGIEERKAREVEERIARAVTVGLVGYTNAGKSTLMNTLTDAGVSTGDQLFHTLETRTRRWPLADGLEVLLSDTVGFISNLPHHLIASFHATLEEAAHASMLLHVVDVSHPEALLQMRSVDQVLRDLGLDKRELVVVFNKVDKLEDRSELAEMQNLHPDYVMLSAATGEGVDDLCDRVRRHVLDQLVQARFTLDYTDRRVTDIERVGIMLERSYDGDGQTLAGRFWPADYKRLLSLGLEPG